jgi:hypothetical protein
MFIQVCVEIPTKFSLLPTAVLLESSSFLIEVTQLAWLCILFDHFSVKHNFIEELDPLKKRAIY